MNTKLIFTCRWNRYLSRYFSTGIWVFSMFLSISIIPILFGDGFITFKIVNILFFTDFRITSIFLAIFLISQFFFYFDSQKSTKRLEIEDDRLIVTFFNGTSLDVHYQDIQCLKRTQDMFRNYVIVLKNGEEKTVRASIRTPDKAFEYMQKNLKRWNV